MWTMNNRYAKMSYYLSVLADIFTSATLTSTEQRSLVATASSCAWGCGWSPSWWSCPTSWGGDDTRTMRSHATVCGTGSTATHTSCSSRLSESELQFFSSWFSTSKSSSTSVSTSSKFNQANRAEMRVKQEKQRDQFVSQKLCPSSSLCFACVGLHTPSSSWSMLLTRLRTGSTSLSSFSPTPTPPSTSSSMEPPTATSAQDTGRCSCLLPPSSNDLEEWLTPTWR